MMFMLYTEYGNHFGRNVIKTGIIPVGWEIISLTYLI